MPRKGEVRRREVLPDPKFHDRLVTKFVNSMMLGGKKSVAEGIFYGALDLVAARTKDDAAGDLPARARQREAAVEVRSRRVGGATYQVPVEVRPVRRMSLGMRWLVQYARGRSEKSMAERLAGEIIDAANNRGAAMKKKDDTHRMAEANKAFAHYRW